jgi:hypothetical protein
MTIQRVANSPKKMHRRHFLRQYQETRVNFGLSSTSMLKGVKERGKISLRSKIVIVGSIQRR